LDAASAAEARRHSETPDADDHSCKAHDGADNGSPDDALSPEFAVAPEWSEISPVQDAAPESPESAAPIRFHDGFAGAFRNVVHGTRGISDRDPMDGHVLTLGLLKSPLIGIFEVRVVRHRAGVLRN